MLIKSTVMLPPELLKYIFDEVARWDDYASRADLKNLRLSCRYFSWLAAPYLFQTLPLWLGMSSLMNLVEAAECPHIAPLITGITFSPMSFIDTYRFDEKTLKRQLKQRLESECMTLNQYEMQYNKYLNGWKMYAADREQLFIDGPVPRARNILLRCFKGLPNLHRIHIATERNVIGAAEAKRLMGRLSGEEFTKGNLDSLEYLFSALADASKTITILQLGDRERYETGTSKRRKELQIKYGYLKPTSLGCFRDDRHLHSDALTYAINSGNSMGLLSSLKVLKMDTINYSDEADNSVGRMTAGIRGMLKCWPPLETLVIEEVLNISDTMENLDLANAMPAHMRFRQLKMLTFGSCKATEDFLADVISVSAATLKRIRLYEFEFTTGSWEGLLRRLRARQWPELQRFYVENIGQPYGGDCAPYLKGFEDEHPLEVVEYS